MPKRANGEGNIKRRADGTWEARATVGDKRKSVYGKTQAEVVRKLKELISERDNGIDLSVEKMTVEQWLDVWITEYVISLKDSTLAKYKQDIRLYILPSVGGVKLSSLTPVHVQRTYNKLLSEGLSAKSVKNVHGILHSALSKAEKLGYVSKNVCDVCDLPAVKKDEMRPITGENIPIFLNRIKGSDLGDFMFVAMFTGMRQSELIGLTWDCIDFNQHMIRVYRQLFIERKKGGGGEYVFGKLKNGKERTFSAVAEVFDALLRVKRKQAEQRLMCGGAWSNPNNLIFTNEVGKNLTAITVWRKFKKIVNDMGIGETRFHDLRHTFATMGIEAGYDIKTLSDALGHATTAFTMDVYGHTTTKMKQENAQKMQTYISKLL